MIPKLVHLSWKTKDILESNHPLITNGIGRLQQMNPNWKFVVSDDSDIEEYLKNNLTSKGYEYIRNVHIVQKSDLWRLFKIYIEGGLYIDIDRLCNVKLDDIINDEIKWVLPTCRDYDFSQDIMMSEPGNPVFAKTIELFMQRKIEGCENTYFLGSQTYMHSITMMLCGTLINTNPGLEIMNDIRKKISELSFVKTYREDPPNNTIVYHGNDIDNWENTKRDFYAQSSVKHWTGEW
jgi:hypothetical protein